MFQFKEGRLYPDVIPQTLSVQIPDQFWIDTNMDGYVDNGITFCTLDRKIKVEILLTAGKDMCLEAEAGNELEESEPITVGGFCGTCVYCLTNLPQCILMLDVSSCGFRSASEPDAVLDQLVFILFAGESSCREEARRKLQEVLGNPDVQELIRSVRVR